MENLNSNRPASLAILAFAVLLLVSGCSEQFLPHELSDDTAEQIIGSEGFGKLRHGHLLSHSNKFVSQGKDGDQTGLGLVLVFDRQEMEAQKVIERYEYGVSFDGYAVLVEDSLGLNDYAAFLAELDSDPLIAWYEPDFGMSMPLIADNIDDSGQMIPWSVAVVGGMQSLAASGDGRDSVPIDLFVLDTGVSNSDVNVVEAVDFRDMSQITGVRFPARRR